MSFSSFDLSNDVASIVSSINEVVSISSSIYSVDLNVKFFNNVASGSAGTNLGGYWETLYDSSPTSSFSTPLVDITFGYSTGSIYNVAATVSSSQNEKVKIYRQMAAALLGNPDSTFTLNNLSAQKAFFICVKRNIQKDEIKKGSVNLVLLQPTASLATGGAAMTASDATAVTQFYQSYGGDYAPLFFNGTGSQVGQVWYNAGIILIDPALAFPGGIYGQVWSGSVNMANAEYSGSINQLCDGLRGAGGLNGNGGVQQINFHNQTNLYSTCYFCRAKNTDFNYSSNPTFVDGNQRIVVTSGSNILQTRTYITTVGLYNANDDLLAVAKINAPITKSPDTESVLRVRLDY